MNGLDLLILGVSGTLGLVVVTGYYGLYKIVSKPVAEEIPEISSSNTFKYRHLCVDI